MTNKMNIPDSAGSGASKFDQYHRQQLSALVDGELAADEARFMLRRIEHDAELAACQERWQLLGDVLRGNACAPAPADFSERVRQALQAEIRSNGAVSAPGAGPVRRHWKRWGGGAAIAASVAMAAMFMTRQQLPQTQPPGPTTVIAAQAQLPATPAPAGQGNDAGLAAVVAVPAVAAAVVRRQDPARRGSATRTQQAARGVAARQLESAPAVAVNANAPALALPAAAAIRQDPFAHASGTLPARPWPRSSAGAAAMPQGVFNASVPVHDPQAAFYPFEPRLPGAESEPAPLHGLPPRQ